MFDPENDRHLIGTAVRRELLRIATREEEFAATAAASVPYWAPHPPTVQAHRAAAAALRADLLFSASRHAPSGMTT